VPVRQKDRDFVTGTRRVPDGKRRVKMAQNECVILWPREVHAVAVSGRYRTLGPGHNVLEREMGELSGEASIMIPSHGNQLGSGREFSQDLLNPGTFRLAGTRSMNHIAQEHVARGLQLVAHSQQLLARASIC